MLGAACLSAWNLYQSKAALTTKNNTINAQQQLLDTLTKELQSAKQELTLALTNQEKNKTELAETKAAQEKAANDLLALQKQLADKQAEQSTKETDLQGSRQPDQKNVPSSSDNESTPSKTIPGGLEGKILAVNETYHFVVINLGEHHGMIKGSEITMKRGSQILGEAKVTSVEPLTSVADLVMKSIPKGITIQSGDSILYQGPGK